MAKAPACPFYGREKKALLVCLLGGADTAGEDELQIEFPNLTCRKRYSGKYCCGDWKACTLASELLEEYELQSRSRYIMTAKEYLSRARDIRAEVQQLQRMKGRAWDRATRSTAQLSEAPAHGGGSGKDPMIAYAEYSQQLEARTADLLNVQREILRTIEQVPDSRYRLLLRARYLEGMTWEQIAVEMAYSWRQMLRMHGDVLQVVGEILS